MVTFYIQTVMELIGYETVAFVILYTLNKKLCIAVARNSFTIVTELLLARKPKVITARVATDIFPEIHSTEQGECIVTGKQIGRAHV